MGLGRRVVDLAAGGSGDTYRWLKVEGFLPPVLFLARPDGSPTANIQEMDGLLRHASPHKLVACGTPQALPKGLHGPLLAPTVAGAHGGQTTDELHLQHHLMAIMPSAMCLDGWSRQGLAGPAGPGFVGPPLDTDRGTGGLSSQPDPGVHLPHPEARRPGSGMPTMQRHTAWR